MPVIVHIVQPPQLMSLILSCMIFLYINGWWSLTTLICLNKTLVESFKEKCGDNFLGNNILPGLK